MYKTSKFNYFTKNLNGEILLFNTYKGPSSLIKFTSEQSDYVEDVMTGKECIENAPQQLIKTLLNCGYIVPQNEDENEKLKLIHANTISSPTLFLTIIPTMQCNFRCKYCYETFEDEYMDDKMKNAIILYLQKNLYKYSDLHISWFGGEPLLCMDFIEDFSAKVKEVCKFHKKSFTASMTTNGYLLTADNYRKLSKCNLIYYQITIDGVKEIHDIQRPHVEKNTSTFDVITKNLLDIKQKTKSKRTTINIRSNFSKLNVEKILEYKKYFSNNFGDDSRFKFSIYPVSDWGGEQIKEFEKELFEKNTLNDIYKLLDESQHKLHLYNYHFMYKGSTVCYGAKKNAYVIKYNGKIHKCTLSFENDDYSIGEITDNGELNLNDYKESVWLSDFNRCNNQDCFYAPICLKESCPFNRIQGGKVAVCPNEKTSLSHHLRLLDSNNNIFLKVGYVNG